MNTIRTTVLLAAVALAVTARAHISYTVPGLIYAESFDSLPSAPNNGTNSWVDNVTLPGWYLVNALTNTPIDIGITRGDTTTGRFYSFGLISDTDRALGGIGSGGAYFGGPASGALAGYWGVKIQNNTGLALTEFDVEYTIEQWRDANTSSQPLVVEWAIDPPGWIGTGWNAGASTPSPVNFGANAWLDGNHPTNRVTGVTFSATGLSWTPGQMLWIRFRELNDVGNDHGLAIDDFSFKAVPEPAVGGLLLSAAVMLLLRRRLAVEPSPRDVPSADQGSREPGSPPSAG